MMKRLASTALAFAITLAVVTAAFSADITRTTKEELKTLMDQGAHVVVLDVRKGSDWKGSEFKIKGAERATDLDKIAKSHSKDARVVLYCA